MKRLGRRLTTAALGVVILSACGGGGGDSSPVPPSTTYMLSGTVNNLAPGSNGVTLALNGTVDGTYGTNGGIQFPPVPSGNYTISIVTQPSSPSQTCTVSPANVVILNTDITNVSVSCTPTYYTIGGVVHGVANTTLTLAAQINASAVTYLPLADDQSLDYPTFTFPTAVLAGTTYNTSIAVQPSGPGFSATCEFAPGTQSGTVLNANVASIVVNCSASPAPPPVAQLAISTDGQTLSLFKLSSALASTGAAPTPLQILQTPNITGVAADPSGTIYYTADAGTPGSNAKLYVCPTPPVAGQPYSCAPFANGYAAAIPGGKLLNSGFVLNPDGFAGGSLLEASITSSGTTIYQLSPNPAAATSASPTGAIQPLTSIYTSNNTPVDVSAQFGGGVEYDDQSAPYYKAALYVWETNAGSTFGSCVHAYACVVPCKPAMQIDITQPLLAAIGSPEALSGQLLVDRAEPDNIQQATLIVGLANPYGSTPSPSGLSTVATVSGQVTVLTDGQLGFTVTNSPGDTDSVNFPLLAGNLNPFVATSALALDLQGNLYVAHALTSQGQSIAPNFLNGYSFSGYAGFLSKFQYEGFACSSTPASCSVDLLPTLAVSANGVPTPQVMTIVPTCQPYSTGTTTYCGTLTVQLPFSGGGTETLLGTFAFAPDPPSSATSGTQTISNCYLVILGTDPLVTNGCSSGSFTTASGAFQLSTSSDDATITISGTAGTTAVSANVTISNFDNLNEAPGSGTFTGVAVTP